MTGRLALGPEFAAWGPIALDGAEPEDVDDVLGRGCVGISLPAGALASPDSLERLGPVLERVALLDVPLFVHPGRAPGQRATPSEFGEPLWWRALTDYVSQMQAAWLTFMALGRREHPELKVLFAMLAGVPRCWPSAWIHEAARASTSTTPTSSMRPPATDRPRSR